MMTSKTMTIITMIMNKAEDFVDGWRTDDRQPTTEDEWRQYEDNNTDDKDAA